MIIGYLRPIVFVKNEHVISLTLGLVCFFIQFTWAFKNSSRICVDLELIDHDSHPLVTTELTVMLLNLYAKVGIVWKTL